LSLLLLTAIQLNKKDYWITLVLHKNNYEKLFSNVGENIDFLFNYISISQRSRARELVVGGAKQQKYQV